MDHPKSSSTRTTSGARWCASRTRSSRRTPTGGRARGIHRRGAHLAARLHRLVSDLLETDVPARHRHRLLPRRPRHARGAVVPRATAVPAGGPHDRPGRRRSLHGPHGAGRDRGAVRLRAAARCSSPSSPTAATASSHPSRLRRQEPPTHRAGRSTCTSPSWTARTRSPSPAARRPAPDASPALHRGPRPPRRRAAILDRAGRSPRWRARVKKVARRGGVPNLFYELRPDSSFDEWRPRRSAPRSSTSSPAARAWRRESLKDTVQTLGAYRPDLIVVRTPHVGALRTWSRAGARRPSSTPGDGKLSTHPGAARRPRCASGSARSTARTSGSSATCCTAASPARTSWRSPCSARVICRPPTLIPRGMEALGCEVAYTLDRLPEADVVYALRMQKERMTESFVRPCASTPPAESTAAGSATARC